MNNKIYLNNDKSLKLKRITKHPRYDKVCTSIDEVKIKIELHRAFKQILMEVYQ